MSSPADSAHDRAILNSFTQQASGFAAGPELHARDVVQLIVEAACPKSQDRAIDLACGPGSVACALAEIAAHVTGLDATPAMVEEARKRAAETGTSNVSWQLGNVYEVPCPDAAFEVVTCRFAFHHFTTPPAAFAEMLRLAAPGGRIVLCDGICSDDPKKAAAFNAMERFRDPSTTEFRTLDYLRGLFRAAGLKEPAVRHFQVHYLVAEHVATSFPEGGDRAGLQRLLEESVEGDTLGMMARRTPEGVRIAYPAVVLSAVKPG